MVENAILLYHSCVIVLACALMGVTVSVELNCRDHLLEYVADRLVVA